MLAIDGGKSHGNEFLGIFACIFEQYSAEYIEFIHEFEVRKGKYFLRLKRGRFGFEY